MRWEFELEMGLLYIKDIFASKNYPYETKTKLLKKLIMIATAPPYTQTKTYSILPQITDIKLNTVTISY